MTTIAYKDGVLAADSRAYSGDRAPIGYKTKIHRLADGTLFGCSSATVGADALLRRWVESGCPVAGSGEPVPEAFEMLLVRPNGDVFFASKNLDLSGPLTAPFYAVGSGNQYALGAMQMGASAVAAIEVACALDIWTSGTITVLRRDA